MHHERRTPGPIERTSGIGPEPTVEATFVPHRYEPNYAYPLLVLLHGRGGDEQQLVDSMPTMSWRNYVGLGVRGPEAISRSGRPAGFGWGTEFRHPSRQPGPEWDELDRSELVTRILTRGAADSYDDIEDAVFAAVRKTRRCFTFIPSASSWSAVVRGRRSPIDLV